MILGIVGHEGAKFTPDQEVEARANIMELFKKHNPTKVVSGACHLGGIDVWAIEEAKAAGLDWEEFAPENLRWEPKGYKERNLKIASVSDRVVCIVVEKLPTFYTGMKFPLCYHCIGRNPPHVKSGGCWTAWKAKSKEWIIIP